MNRYFALSTTMARFSRKMGPVLVPTYLQWDPRVGPMIGGSHPHCIYLCWPHLTLQLAKAGCTYFGIGRLYNYCTRSHNLFFLIIEIDLAEKKRNLH